MSNRFSNKELMEHSEALLIFANKKVNDIQSAEDIVQDCLVSAWKKQDDFRGDSEFRTWLFAILKYKILDFYRKKYKNTEVNIDDVTETSFFTAYGAWDIDPRNSMDTLTDGSSENRAKIKHSLRLCMSYLSEKNKALIRLREMEDFGMEDVSERFGMTTNTLAVTLSRVRLKLRSCLQKKLSSEVQV